MTHFHVSIRPAACSGAAAFLLAALVAAACSDSTGPRRVPPPGTLLLDGREFAEWKWLPGGDEIIYSTPSNFPEGASSVRLEAVTVSNGQRRTVATAPSGGGRIIGYRFIAQGSHVYFEVSYTSSSKISIYRAPLAGSSAPELVVDAAPYGVAVSPNERTVAWVESDQSALRWSLVTVEIATGARRAYPLEQPGSRVVWSPSERSAVVHPGDAWFASGTPFQWLDLESGAVRVWLAPSSEFTAGSTGDFHWDGETPWLYTTGAGPVVRYSLATGARETLAASGGYAVGWAPDFETVVLAASWCLQEGSGPFGSGCLRWGSEVERLRWRSGDRANVLRHEGPSAIGGRLSPTGQLLAYVSSGCGGGCYTQGDGLYVVPVP